MIQDKHFKMVLQLPTVLLLNNIKPTMLGILRLKTLKIELLQRLLLKKEESEMLESTKLEVMFLQLETQKDGA